MQGNLIRLSLVLMRCVCRGLGDYYVIVHGWLSGDVRYAEARPIVKFRVFIIFFTSQRLLIPEFGGMCSSAPYKSRSCCLLHLFTFFEPLCNHVTPHLKCEIFDALLPLRLSFFADLMTVVLCFRYVIFYSPFDIGYKVVKFLPFKVVLSAMKEVRAILPPET